MRLTFRRCCCYYVLVRDPGREMGDYAPPYNGGKADSYQLAKVEKKIDTSKIFLTVFNSVMFVIGLATFGICMWIR